MTVSGRTRSKTGISAALTQTTIAAEAVSISIPAEQGGTLIAVEVEAMGVLETVVNTGGRVQLHNSAEHWEPFDFYTGADTCVTLGAISENPFRLKCNKPLPSNSTVTVDYTPIDNQSQKLTVTLHWLLGGFSGGAQTYAKSMIGAAVTATARVASGTIQIPGGHSGTLKAIETVVFATLTTVVNAGGLVEVENDAVDMKPSEFYSGKQTCVTSGADAVEPLLEPKDDPAPENSTYTIYFTPQNAASLQLAAAVIWEA